MKTVVEHTYRTEAALTALAHANAALRARADEGRAPTEAAIAQLPKNASPAAVTLRAAELATTIPDLSPHQPAVIEPGTPTVTPTAATRKLSDALATGRARVCDTCGDVLPLNAFGDDVTPADTHVTTCTDCSR